MSRVRAAVCVVVIACTALGGCGEERPVRIGVLAECLGFVEALREPMVGAVEVPFIRRGARARGARPTDGIAGARIGGRPVEILEGCVETTEFHRLVSEVRRLVEVAGADIIIGPSGPTDGVVLREVAKRYPNVTFLIGWAGGQDSTLRHRSPNVYRLTPADSQAVAGLATYAYKTLGWRTATIVAEDHPIGWTAAAGFTAEFCALGGAVVARDWASLAPFGPSASREDIARDTAADGVAVLSWYGSIFPVSPAAFMSQLVRAGPDPARRIVLGGATFTAPGNLSWDADSRGIVMVSDVPYQPNSEGATIASVMSAAFTTIPPEAADLPAAVWFGVAGEAVARALEATNADLGPGGKAFREALSRLAFDAQSGPVRFDEDNQGIITTYLGKIGGPRTAPVVQELRRISDVRQDFGGIFTADSPSVTRTSPGCKRYPPPPWAR